MNEKILLISQDNNFIEQVKSAKGYDIEITHEVIQDGWFRCDLSIVDISTVDVSSDKWKRIKDNSRYVVLVVNETNESQLTDYIDIVDDVWFKPISILVLHRRIKTLMDWVVKVRDVSDFMGFTSAELKNPLSPIRGWSDLLLKFSGEPEHQQEKLPPLTDFQREVIENIYQNATRIGDILTDLRDAARIQARQFDIEPYPIVLKSILIEAFRFFENRSECLSTHNLDKAIGENLPQVMADETRIIQVVTALIDNACKYSSDGSTITINANLNNDFVRISVQDEGIGISEDDQEKLFRIK